MKISINNKRGWDINPAPFFILYNMAKNCLVKLSGNILQDCIITPVGVKDIYLIYIEDVTLSPNSERTTLVSVTFVGGAKAYRVEGYKQNIQVVASLRSMDASAKLDISVSFKVPRGMLQTFDGGVRPLLTGRFYVLVDYVGGGSSVLLGDTSPLEVTSFDFDSNAGAGFATITLGAPEGSAGNYFLHVSTSAKNTIISKSV